MAYSECPTRWNLCYDMLERILLAQNPVMTTLAALMRNDLLLQPHEWQIIEKVVPILKPFYEITTEVSAEKVVILSKVLIFVQLMGKHLTACALEPCQHTEVTTVIKTLTEQLQLRFNDLEKNVLYSDSTILDPRFKKKGFKTPDSFNRASESLKRRLCDIRLQHSQTTPGVEDPVPVQRAIPAGAVLVAYGTSGTKKKW